MSWREIILGDAIHVKHGFAFKSQHFSNNGEYIVLTPGNFHEKGGFRLRSGKDRFYTGDIPEEYVLCEGDLIIAMTEQGPGLLGSSALIPDGDRFLHNQRLGLIQDLDETVLNKKFLHYLFNTRSVRGQISGSATGTKVKHTAPERIYRVKATVPSKVIEQKKIATILSAYDDLIENNRRRIQLLEQAARLLYREWFVRLRFPGHEHVKIINGVPEGWEKSAVSKMGDVVTGKTPSTKEPDNFGGKIPFIKTPDMHKNPIVIEIAQYLSEQGANSQAKKYIPEDSIMVSCIGTVGIVAINAIKAQTNQQINTVIPQKEHSRYYAYFALGDLKSRLEAMGGGATMVNVNKCKFESLPIVIPSGSILHAFHEVCKPIFLQIKNLLIQNQKLKQARDLLLPRLMNGEIAL